MKRTLSADIECDSVIPSTHLLSYLDACVHIQCRAAILLLSWCVRCRFHHLILVRLRREIRARTPHVSVTLAISCDVIAVAFY